MKKIIAMLLMATVLLAGCGGEAENTDKTPVSVDLEQLYTRLEVLGLPAMVEVGQQMQLDLYGIAASDVVKAKVFISDDGLRADEVWLIEAVDAEAAARIETLANNRIRQKDDESVTYSPEQNAIVKKSYLAVEGRFVFFICSPEVEAMKAAVNEALGK